MEDILDMTENTYHSEEIDDSESNFDDIQCFIYILMINTYNLL